MRSLTISTVRITQRTVMRVTQLENLANEWAPSLHFLVPVASRPKFDEIARMTSGGLSNITVALPTEIKTMRSRMGAIPMIRLDKPEELQPGDVVAVNPAHHSLQVLLRESDTHHALFLTNRCNNNCMMCSQPPTRQDDSWLLEEALSAIRHVRHAPARLGLTGGEPLLYGEDLRKVFDAVAEYLPGTQIELLTNGRQLSDPAVSASLLNGLRTPISWFVPLYGHADFLHDFVVQMHGAFDETLSGLLCLQAYRQPIQLRVVLIEPVLKVLPQLCAFIGRNFPSVRELALMGCEPVGFALANRTQCEVNLTHWASTLEHSVHLLDQHAIPVLLMNIPHCALPKALWSRATQSISDWKQTYAHECATCAQKKHCCGLFSWHKKSWGSAPIASIKEEIAS